MSDRKTDWFAFLTNLLVESCLRKSVEECPGCRDGKFSPLLHRHYQLGLLDKIGRYFETVKTELIEEMDKMLTIYKSTPHCSAEFEEAMIGEGVDFLLKSTPSIIYFGQYVVGFNDIYVEKVCEKTQTPAKSSRKRPKKLKIFS